MPERIMMDEWPQSPGRSGGQVGRGLRAVGRGVRGTTSVTKKRSEKINVTVTVQNTHSTATKYCAIFVTSDTAAITVGATLTLAPGASGTATHNAYTVPSGKAAGTYTLKAELWEVPNATSTTPTEPVIATETITMTVPEGGLVATSALTVI